MGDGQWIRLASLGDATAGSAADALRLVIAGVLTWSEREDGSVWVNERDLAEANAPSVRHLRALDAQPSDQPIEAEANRDVARNEIARLRGALRVLEAGVLDIEDGLDLGLDEDQSGDSDRRFDGLTGLPLGAALLERVEHDLSVRRRGQRVVLLRCDIDRFTVINDAHGREVGDRVLLEIAARLRAVVRPRDLVCRLEGDGFGIVALGPFSEEAADEFAARVVETLSSPILLSERSTSPVRELAISATAGIAIGGGSPLTPADLLSRADLAMQHAKELGRNRHAQYQPDLESRRRKRDETELAIRAALTSDGIRTWYQPIVNLDDPSGPPSGVEALVRIETQAGTLLGPEQFVPIAEDTNLIFPLAERVLQDACQQVATWIEAGHELDLHVNLSSCQITPDLADMVSSALNKAALDPSRLSLELTETSFVELDGDTLAWLERVRQLGVRLGLDDFGTGYASLTTLRRIRAEFIKIDRTFVAAAATDPYAEAIIKATLALAAALDLEVIAEGVETDDELLMLTRWGCRKGQGFLFSAPVPARRFTQALKSL